MARGLWKGAISFGLVNVPVELFSAEKTSSNEKIHQGETEVIGEKDAAGADVIDLMALLKKSVEKSKAA